MKRKRAQRLLLLIGVAGAVLLVFLFLIPRFTLKFPGLERQQTGPSSSHENSAPTTDRPAAKRVHEPAGFSAASANHGKDSSEIAFKKIQAAFGKLIAARPVTEATTLFDTDGTMRRTMMIAFSSAKDETGSILLRGETICYDPKTNAPDSKQHRIEISNAEGNWELRGAAAIQDVAFLHLDDTEALSSIGTYKAAVATASGNLDPNRSYSERNELYHGRLSTIVTENIMAVPGLVLEYMIDCEAETLVKMNLGSVEKGPIMETLFETNPPLAPSLFEIPDSKLILPTKDIQSDAMAISKGIK